MTPEPLWRGPELGAAGDEDIQPLEELLIDGSQDQSQAGNNEGE